MNNQNSIFIPNKLSMNNTEDMSSNISKLSNNTSVTLDLIRCLSAQAVLVGHAISFFDITQKLLFIQLGGVVVFFILSGLLITYSIQKSSFNNSYSFKHFFLDRFSRIYLGLIPSLAFIGLFDFILLQFDSSYGYKDAFNIKTLIGNLLMLQDFPILNFANITSFASGRPLWTLAIEWWFYLWFGWLILKGKHFFELNIGGKIQFFIVLTFLSIVPVFNAIGGRGGCLTIIWLFGALILAFLNKNLFANNKYSSIFLLFISFSVLIVCTLRLKTNKNIFDGATVSMFSISFFCFLQAVNSFSQQLFTQKMENFIRFASSYSYTLYLTHYTILSAMCLLKHVISPWVLLILSFVICNLTAILIAFLTEMRHKKVREFFRKQFQLG